MKTRRALAVTFLVFGILVAPSSNAQIANTGSVQGTVSDPSGAMLVDARVTLVSQDTGAAQSAQTDAAGGFAFPIVPAGQYRLEGFNTRFKSFSQRDIFVHPGEPFHLSVAMTLGQASENGVVT